MSQVIIEFKCATYINIFTQQHMLFVRVGNYFTELLLARANHRFIKISSKEIHRAFQ